MPLPINIHEIFRGRLVEWEQLEFETVSGCNLFSDEWLISFPPFIHPHGLEALGGRVFVPEKG